MVWARKPVSFLTAFKFREGPRMWVWAVGKINSLSGMTIGGKILSIMPLRIYSVINPIPVKKPAVKMIVI